MDKPKVIVNIMVRKDDKILCLLKNKLQCWTFPGGHLEPFETIEECAKRETFEETNVEIKNINVIELINDIEKKFNEHYLMIWTEAEYESGEIENKEEKEFSEIKWIEETNLPENFFIPVKKFLSGQGYIRKNNIENLVIVAHPDDEIIWFSSILKKPNTLVVICFQNKNYLEGKENLEYTTKASNVFKEYEKIVPIIWLQTLKTTTPKMFGEMKKEILDHLESNIKTLLEILKPKKVFTHNPWGEYGHTEHIAIHNIVKQLRKDILFPSVILGKAEERVKDFRTLLSKTEETFTEKTDLSFKKKFEEIYRKERIWTGKDEKQESTEKFSKYK